MSRFTSLRIWETPGIKLDPTLEIISSISPSNGAYIFVFESLSFIWSTIFLLAS